ncbi:hypothetical protein AY599_26580 [Leptolyngbya valderiana BDU 20041]|nr:hypothetical protein AY599_26580 [Leptolyngbya valderiana BDU 20041]
MGWPTSASAASAETGRREPRGDTRERLLDAAARVMLARGALGLTLDAVAAEAEVSKGGLLYHFPSKEVLLRAMVAHLVEATEARIAASLQGEAKAGAAEAPGGWLRGYLAAWVQQTEGAAADRKLGQALLAAAAVDPRFLEDLRRQDAAWGARLRADGLDPLRALIVRLAIDGLWFNETFGLPVVAANERAALRCRLEEMTRP